MAIKFSQFVVQTDASTLSHVVGYNGADNIQITPTNFLNSLLTGTAGQVLYYDTTGVAGENAFFWDNTNKRLGIGTNTPNYKVHIEDNSVTTGSKTLLQLQSDPINNGGSLNLDFRVSSANTDDRYVARISGMREGNGALSQLQFWTESSGLYQRMTITSAGNVGIGTTSPSAKLEVSGNIKVGDSEQFIAGTGNDLKILHNSTDSFIINETGNFYISNQADDKDIIFTCDDGAGGTTTYFTLDGSRASGAYTYTTRPDGGVITFGDGLDLRLWHDPNTNKSYMRGYNHDLYIEAITADTDILFRADNGSGGLATYFTLDGSLTQMWADKDIQFSDNIKAKFGSSSDLSIYHNGTTSNSNIENTTGDLYVSQYTDDGNIIFRSDDGAGGIIEYLRLDGATRSVVVRAGLGMYFNDGVAARFGTSGDMILYHSGSHSYLENYTGDLVILNNADDKDIIFQSDDGAGGTAEYFRLDGGLTKVVVNKSFIFEDNIQAQFGSSADLQIYHDTTDTWLDNFTGNLNIRNQQNSGDIIFRSDNGNGGITEYFRLDGGNTNMVASKTIIFNDNVKASFGSGEDLRIFHDGTDSQINNVVTGDLYIQNFVDDKNIIFRCDDGGGGVTEYFRLDGNLGYTVVSKNILLDDNVKLRVGSSADLEIYHDGGNSYIQDTGTGELKLLASSVAIQSASGNEYIAYFAGTGGQTASLYAGNVKKLETKSTGINIQGVTEYANNTSALAGGLVVGDVYRTADLLKIVH